MKVHTSYENEYTIHIENTKLHIHVENHRDSADYIPATASEHRHLFAEIFLCGEGSIEISADKETVLVGKGDAVVIPPGISHVVTRKSENAKYFVLNFLCERSCSGDVSDLYSDFIVLYNLKEILQLHDVPELYGRIDEILCSERQWENMVCAMRFAEVLLHLSYRYADLKNSEKHADSEYLRSSMQNYKKLDKLINSTFSKVNSAQIIASEMFISTRQLDRIAKKKYGMTLHRVINENRLMRAEKLLSVTDISVDKIAVQSGFSSRASFYRAFAEKYGCTPAKYRKK